MASVSTTNPIFEWNVGTTESEYRCVHDLIQDQIRQGPETTALCSASETLTYRELDQTSTLIAKRLLALGVKPNTFVALSFEHSIWTAVAILAVWKSGAAFAPLPEGPPSRIDTILNKLEAPVVLCSASRASSVLQYRRMSMTVGTKLKDEAEQLTFGDTAALGTGVSPSDLAYAIFTSGSTGTPKAAQVEHRQFATYIRAWTSALKIRPTSRVFSYSSYMFDVSISDIVTPLVCGATLCVPSEDDRFNNIAGSMRDMGVTHANFVPSLLSTLEPQTFDLKTLEVVAVVGEKLPQHLLERWNNIPDLRFINSYGPAECCPHCCLLDTSTKTETAANIGNAFASALWIVDPDNLEVPLNLGQEGELIIEGPLVGRGYLNEPEKTAVAFPEAPSWLAKFRNDSSSRIYRTGDICRYNENGTIEYVGRKDLQVKIRGQRMELGEVEHHLRQVIPHADIAVDIGRFEGRDVPVLVAFVVPQDLSLFEPAYETTKQAPTTTAAQEQLDLLVQPTREQLATRLPNYMIPSVYVALHHIPRLASAKTDRKALRALADETCLRSAKSTEQTSLEPWTPLQQVIGQIWAETFNINHDSLTLDRDFFALGGDSITAIRMRLAALKYEVQLTMQDIFGNPTIRGLSQVAGSAARSDVEIAPFGLLAEDQREEIRALAAAQCQVSGDDIQDVFPAQMNVCWFMLSSSSVPGGWMSCNAFPLSDDVDLDRYLACWTAAIEGHVNLRSRVIATATTIYQVELKHNAEPYRSVSCSLDDFVKEEKQADMGWGRPLSRFSVLTDPKDGKRYFVWTAKQAVFDHWSLMILYGKICRAYATENLLLRETLKPNAVIQNYQQADLASAKHWFRNYFQGAYPQPLFKVAQDFKFVEDVQEVWSLGLQAPERSSPFTLATIVGVAWALTLAHRIDTQDFILGLIRSGRNLPLPGVDEFTGPLTALMPLRVRPTPSAKVYDLLRKYQADWTESSGHDAYSWVELCDDDNLPAVKGAVANPVTLNIVPNADPDLNYEVEIPIKDGLGACREVSAQNLSKELNDTYSLLPTPLSGLEKDFSLVPPSRYSDGSSPTPSINSVSDVLERSLSATPTASSSTTPEESPSTPKTYRKHVKDLLPPLIEKGLDSSQKPINLNVFLPQTGFDLRVKIRRDTTACTEEFANALVGSFTKVVEQLLSAHEDLLVSDLNIPDTRHIKASAWD